MVQCHLYCIDGSLRAPQEVHREDATTRRERSDAIGIDADSGRDQYEAVRKETYEVQRTPTPVRVTKVLPGPTLGRWHDHAGSGGTTTGAGR